MNKYDIVRTLYLSDKNYQIIRQLNDGIDLSVEEFYMKYLKK